MKKLLIIFLVSITNISLAQSKFETETWISEKIKMYGEKSSDVENDYILTFKNGLIEVTHTTKINNRLYTINAYITIKDISSFQFTEEKDVILLKIQTNDTSKVKSKLNFEDKYKLSDNYNFILNKSFKNNDLINRMTKAINNLIKLNGGKKEAF
jgi:hypothetical protein